MHARLVRSAAAVAVAVTATLTWAPAASAQPSEPTPSASAVPAETPAPDAGSAEITAKDTAGDVLPGATLLLLDSTGQEAGRGKTDSLGKLTFPGLAPGVYRLKETAKKSSQLVSSAAGWGAGEAQRAACSARPLPVRLRQPGQIRGDGYGRDLTGCRAPNPYGRHAFLGGEGE